MNEQWRCKNCRFWKHLSSPSPRNTSPNVTSGWCMRIEDFWEMKDAGDGGNWMEAENLMTGPDFGCVQFQQKEDATE